MGTGWTFEENLSIGQPAFESVYREAAALFKAVVNEYRHDSDVQHDLYDAMMKIREASIKQRVWYEKKLDVKLDQIEFKLQEAKAQATVAALEDPGEQPNVPSGGGYVMAKPGFISQVEVGGTVDHDMVLRIKKEPNP